jgi:hypothetical protein
MRRSSLLILACCFALAGALVVVAPARGAVQPFGPAVTVLSPGHPFGWASGDAAVGSDGIIRGFVAFSGDGSWDDDAIRYFEGSGSTWTSTVSPYRGSVLAVAWDGSATYLLYQTQNGAIHITKRTAAGFTGGRPLWMGIASGTTADLVAAGGNWWAVWSHGYGPGGEFAQAELVQALTLGRGHFHDGISGQRITFNPQSDRSPSLTLLPNGGSGGQVLMAWVRDDGARGEQSAIRYARAAFDGRWTSQSYPTGGRADSPDLFTYGPVVFSAYQRDGRIVQATNPPSGIVSNRFMTPGHGPRVASSYGKTFVGWVSSRSGHIMVGEATAPGVAGELDLTPTARPQALLAVTGRGGKATVIGASFGTHRVWAATQR